MTCAGQVRRLTRSGWGIPIGLGLKGGAGGETSVANGTSGWGPPPSGAVSGWGAPPPPNPAASAAWGAPNPGQGPKPTPNGEYNKKNINHFLRYLNSSQRALKSKKRNRSYRFFG